MASGFTCGVEDLLFSGSRFVWNLTVSTLRRWYTERLRACHQVLRTWCGLRDVYQARMLVKDPRGPQYLEYLECPQYQEQCLNPYMRS